MDRPRRERFDSAFRSRSLREQQQFLADLWAARGWDVSTEGRTLVAVRGGETKRIAIAKDSFLQTRAPPADATVIVALGGRDWPDATVYSVGDVFDMARYGLPEAQSDRLFSAHFGAVLSAPVASRPRRRWVRPLLVLVVLLLVAAAAVATGTIPLSGVQSATQGASPTATATSTQTPTATPVPRSIAPGFSTAGVENATLLAEAHREALGNRSYQWTIGYRESVAGSQTGSEVETVAVEAPNRYLSSVQRSGTLRAFPRPTASEDSFADGSFRYARRPAEPDGVAVRVIDPESVDGPGRQAVRAESYIDWYLSTENSRVVNSTTDDDGTQLYEVVGSGNEFPRSVTYTASAVIEESGLVRSMEVTYETRDGVRVTVWFEYDAMDETTVEPPLWAVNAR
ncbi:hypothetical protein ACFQJC_03585 [Haloferax namakaokahaiae]|uniref:Uncharacterized protein n=1 Tax=Haloferax namakaokahaiae TaxID=1748331 RepID=A0ABD5ZBD3_9EURY